MKKTSLLLSVLIVTSTLCFSCNKNNEAPLPEYSEKLMMDFESLEEVMSVRLTAHEAQSFLNEDKTYVSNGNKSMKMHLNQNKSEIGYYEDTILQFVPGQKYFNHSDFSNVVGINADIWNDNGFDIEMCFSINNKAFVIDYAILKPGYNKVEFNYDNNQVIAVTDKQLLSLDFSFYSQYGNEVLYIDNVKLKTTTHPYQPYSFEDYYNNDMVFGFEDFIERMIIIDLGGYDSLFSKARATINTDEQYIMQGIGSLKVEFYDSPKTGEVDNKYIRTYDNILPDFNKYQKGDWALKCDIFNPNDKDIDLEMTLFSTIDDETITKEFTIESNSWSDNKILLIPISEIREAFTNEQIKVLTIVFGFKNILSGESMYIDNLRIERRNNQI